jgi:predicted nucleic acid-binding protein
MNSTVCVDASILIKLVVAEPGSDRVDSLWMSWIESDARIIAPSLLRYELTAVLRKKVHRGQLDEATGSAALSTALDLMTVEYVDMRALHPRALEIACQHGLPTAYDAHYLALAEIWDCDFWTADRRLYRQVGDRLAFVRCLES